MKSSAAGNQYFIRVCAGHSFASTSDRGCFQNNCEKFLMENPWSSKYVVFCLNGCYNGKRNNTIIEPEAMDEREDKVESDCNQHREVTVMDAVKNHAGLRQMRPSPIRDAWATA